MKSQVVRGLFRFVLATSLLLLALLYSFGADAADPPIHIIPSGVAAGRSYYWEITKRAPTMGGGVEFRAKAHLTSTAGLPEDFLRDYNRFGGLAERCGFISANGLEASSNYFDIPGVRGNGLHSSSWTSFVSAFPRVEHIQTPLLVQGNLSALVEGGVTNIPTHKVLSGRLGWIGMGTVNNIKRDAEGVAINAAVDLHWFKPNSGSLRSAVRIASTRGWMFLPQYDPLLKKAVAVSSEVLRLVNKGGKILKYVTPVLKYAAGPLLVLGLVGIVVEVYHRDYVGATADAANLVLPLPLVSRSMVNEGFRLAQEAASRARLPITK